MSEHIELQGGYYEFGLQLGELKRTEINLALHSFKSGSFYPVLQKYLLTETGRNDLQTFKVTTQMHTPEIVTELKGMAAGAEIEYEDLLLLNLSNEFRGILNFLPRHSYDVEYMNFVSGCTNLLLRRPGQTALVHTEDINPDWVKLGFMVTATIYTDDNSELLEKWTQYVVPGTLPGGTFGFNNHGLLGAHNHIIQKNINKQGLPRTFMCRLLLRSRNIEDVREKLLTSPGIASGFSLQYIGIVKDENTEVHFVHKVLEVAGSESGTDMAEFQPNGFYHHCNIFQHLSHDCHPDESSIHRSATISQYANKQQAESTDDLLTIISDVSNKMFPVYRNGDSPDYIATAATGLFDCKDKKLYIYTDKPSTCEPSLVFPFPPID